MSLKWLRLFFDQLPLPKPLPKPLVVVGTEAVAAEAVAAEVVAAKAAVAVIIINRTL